MRLTYRISGATLVMVLAAMLPWPAPLAAQQADSVSHRTVTLTLADGSVLIGRLVTQDSNTVTLHTDALGQIVIPRATITGGLEAPVHVAAPAPMPAAPTVDWTRTLRFGIDYASVVSPGDIGETKGLQVDASVERRTPKSTLTVSGSSAYQRTAPDPATIDESLLTIIFGRELGGPFSLRSESMIARNQVEELDYRIFEQAGIGWKAVDNALFTMLLTPGVGYTEEHGAGPARLDGIPRQKFKNAKGVADGMAESMTLRPATGFTIVEDLLTFHAFDGLPQLQYTGSLRVIGMVTQHVGMTLEYRREFDSTLPYPIHQLIEKISAGMQFTF